MDVEMGISSKTATPKFRVSRSQKTDKWVKQIVDFADDNSSMYNSDRVRAMVRDCIINTDLYNGKLHVSDMVGLLNPLDLKTIDGARLIKHYPIAAPYIDLLVGEEIHAPFEPAVGITNNIAIKDKVDRMNQYVRDKIEYLVETFQGDEEQLKAEVTKIKRSLRYSYKDIKEVKATAVLEKYSKLLNMDANFVEGYRQVFLSGEELYVFDIVNGRLTVDVVDRTRARYWGGSGSSKIEDADIIVIEDHYSPGKIVDLWGDKLSKTEVDKILELDVAGAKGYDTPYGDATHEFNPVPYEYGVAGHVLDEALSRNYVDGDGNIRVLKVRFKAYKKILKVEYQDPATEELQIMEVPEDYTLQEGERVIEEVWVSEWWKAVKIGGSIITDIDLNFIKYNRLGNLSEGHPGVVGEIYNIGKQEVVPPMTRMKEYQYLYDITIDRLLVAMSKNIGPILEMDINRKPGNWQTQKWLSYMFKYNTKFTDNFKEVNKGPSTGELVGNLASGRDQQLNFDFGNYIQQLIYLAEYIETAVGNIIGITPQRKGAVGTKETLGGIERATSQSSFVTEWYSYKHTNTKIRALNLLVEAGISLLDNEPMIAEYSIDGNIAEALQIMGDDFVNVDIGVSVTNSSDAKEHKRILEQASQAYMQNGGNFSFVFDVLFSKSMADRRRKIEEHEEEERNRMSEEAKAQNDAVVEAANKKKESDDEARALEKYKADLNAMIELKKKEIDAMLAKEKNDNEHTRGLESIANDIRKLQRDMTKDEMDYDAKLKQISSKNTPTR